MFINSILLFIWLIFWSGLGHVGYVYRFKSSSKSHEPLHANSLSICKLRPRIFIDSYELISRIFLTVLSLYVSHIFIWWSLIRSRINNLNLFWISSWWSLMYNNFHLFTSLLCYIFVTVAIEGCITRILWLFIFWLIWSTHPLLTHFFFLSFCTLNTWLINSISPLNCLN